MEERHAPPPGRRHWRRVSKQNCEAEKFSKNIHVDGTVHAVRQGLKAGLMKGRSFLPRFESL